MSDPDAGADRLWGEQHPFERNHLQRSMVLLGLVGVFAVTGVLLVRVDVVEVLGLSLVGAGLLVGLAAASRLRYVRETRLGFQVLRARDGSFVVGSAAGCVLAGVFVVALILR